MRIAKVASELSPAIGRRGLVPTMGALHEGHASLIRLAVDECDEVVVSIFVNPTQFGPSEDLSRYPRTLQSDLELIEREGATTVFIPTVEEMYPLGQDAVRVQVSGVRDLWEGAVRPGHFDGVATVVTQLISVTQPTRIYFGQKDLQQWVVIKRLIAGLRLRPIVVIAPTVRESSGLAMSSRNVYLSPKQRELAPELYRNLVWLRKELLASPTTDPGTAINKAKNKLPSSFALDYLALISVETMEEVNSLSPDAALIVAARVGNTRLIDNLSIFS